MEQYNNLRKVLNEFGQAFINLVADKIIEADGIATGEMLNTLDFDVRQEGGHFTVYLEHTDYFPYYDQGTEPHWPPKEPIIQWVQNKPIYPDADANGNLPTVEELAFLISRKIARDGTEARNVFEAAKQQLIPEWEEKFSAALAQDIMDDYLSGKNFNDWDILKI